MTHSEPAGRLPFHIPDVSEEAVAAVADVIRSGWLTSGPMVAEFERAFAERIGVQHAVALNSCTAALHVALDAIGVGPGDEVIIPAMTFATSAEVVLHLGARPVMVDCDPDSLNLAIPAVEAAITDRTRAIMPVHYGGQACDMDGLLELTEPRGIALIDDAAHAFPADLRGRPVGTLGTATAFSFYATKTITTGEGGMLTTNDGELAERARMLSLHGLSADAWNRYAGSGSWDYSIVAPGYKYNLTDVAATLGIHQLRRAEELWEARADIARVYTKAFAEIPEVMPLAELPDRRHAWHLYVVRIAADALSLDRNGVVKELNAAGIGTSVHYRPLHMHPYFRDRYGYQPSDFPNAAAAFNEIISLPIYSRMTTEDMERVIAAVTDVVTTHRLT